jgi:hypothetical protein
LIGGNLLLLILNALFHLALRVLEATVSLETGNLNTRLILHLPRALLGSPLNVQGLLQSSVRSRTTHRFEHLRSKEIQKRLGPRPPLVCTRSLNCLLQCRALTIDTLIPRLSNRRPINVDRVCHSKPRIHKRVRRTVLQAADHRRRVRPIQQRHWQERVLPLLFFDPNA